MYKKIITLLFIIFFISCSKVPITGRKQVNLLPESSMVSLALTSYKEFISKNPPLPENHPDVIKVRKVGEKIAGAVEKFLKNNGQYKRVKDYKWEFNVVDNKIINAWAMPGGKVVVYEGIMPLVKDENGLAVVLGHEIAHAVARHGNERMSQQLIVAAGGVSLSVAMQEKPKLTRDLFLMSYGIATTLGTLAFSRNQESEADKMGLVFMAMAGYDPEYAVAFWERMANANKSKTPEFLSTHPSDETRIKRIIEFLPEAKLYYKK